MTASRMPFARSPFARLRKKLTVMGMMGHTQGVRRATSPPRNPRPKMTQRLFPVVSFSLPKAFRRSMTGVHRAFAATLSVAAGIGAAAESVAATAVSGASGSTLSSAGAAAAAVGPSLPFTTQSMLVGGRQFSSLQAPNFR